MYPDFGEAPNNARQGGATMVVCPSAAPCCSTLTTIRVVSFSFLLFWQRRLLKIYTCIYFTMYIYIYIEVICVCVHIITVYMLYMYTVYTYIYIYILYIYIYIYIHTYIQYIYIYMYMHIIHIIYTVYIYTHVALISLTSVHFLVLSAVVKTPETFQPNKKCFNLILLQNLLRNHRHSKRNFLATCFARNNSSQLVSFATECNDRHVSVDIFASLVAHRLLASAIHVLGANTVGTLKYLGTALSQHLGKPLSSQMLLVFAEPKISEELVKKKNVQKHLFEAGLDVRRQASQLSCLPAPQVLSLL